MQELLLSTLTEQLQVQGSLDELAAITDTLSIPSVATEDRGNVGNVSQNSNTQSKAVVKPPTSDKSNQASPAKTQPTGGGGSGQGSVSRNHTYSQAGSQGSQIRQNHASHSQVYNPLPGSNSLSLGGASYGAVNPHPLPGRPMSGGRDRDARVNPAAAKKSMFKQLPTSQTSDREPPPH